MLPLPFSHVAVGKRGMWRGLCLHEEGRMTRQDRVKVTVTTGVIWEKGEGKTQEGVWREEGSWGAEGGRPGLKIGRAHV